MFIYLSFINICMTICNFGGEINFNTHAHLWELHIFSDDILTLNTRAIGPLILHLVLKCAGEMREKTHEIPAPKVKGILMQRQKFDRGALCPSPGLISVKRSQSVAKDWLIVAYLRKKLSLTLFHWMSLIIANCLLQTLSQIFAQMLLIVAKLH